jgi:NTE family protein
MAERAPLRRIGFEPPAFPAVRIDGEPYWDGGIYSNTPIEAVLDDKPRVDSVIFTVHMWNPEGPEPASLWEVMGRQKDIQYASRAESHIARQRQIHHLRHIIRELAKHVPEKSRNSEAVKELTSWGCNSTMHVARLIAPRRRLRGGPRVLALAPWQRPVDPMQGVVIHETGSVPHTEIAHGIDGFDGRTRLAASIGIRPRQPALRVRLHQGPRGDGDGAALRRNHHRDRPGRLAACRAPGQGRT